MSCLRIVLLGWLVCGAARADAPKVEQWGLFEIELRGPADGNPFVDVRLDATFTDGKRSTKVPGFYDGDGVYRVRFMPDVRGEWSYATSSNRPALNGKSGRFTVGAPTGKNRGPVGVRNRFHFAYADGSPYYPIGTTCYAWTHAGEDIQTQTLATLKASPFNKLRMCVFPKWYAYNRTEPPRYPFAGTPPNRWDPTHFDVGFFRHLERRVADLRDLGIEADLILFHPYDGGHWGFDRMSAEADDRYVRYVVARLAAYRNVWWSLANEFDFMKEKTDADWNRMLKLVAERDPHAHLRSIHNGTRLFNQTHPLLTHASLQNGSAVADFGRAGLYRDVYEKPIVFDEAKYEGDFEQRWGNLTAEEMVHRFWQGAIAGTYVGHGETYRTPNEIVWWSHGGQLRGSSASRIAFLRKVLEDGPAAGLEPIDKWQDERTAGRAGEYYLVYFGREKPDRWTVAVPKGAAKGPFTVGIEIIDTWNMTVTPVSGRFELKPVGRYLLRADPPAEIPLPAEKYQLLRIQTVREKR